MKLYYYKDPIGNFGDDLNLWLWEKLAPSLLDNKDDELFLGAGTIINDKVPPHCKKIVFGSGAGYGDIPYVDKRWRFFCVRGPLTADALGIDHRLAITDSAGLIPYALSKTEYAINPMTVSFMPHHKSDQLINWQSACRSGNICYISPRCGTNLILEEISKTKLLITEALHGAVVADALGIPWIPVVFFDFIYEFKWWDWCKSLNIDYSPLRFNSFLREYDAEKALLLASTSKPFLSAGQYRNVYEKLIACFENMVSKLT